MADLVAGITSAEVTGDPQQMISSVVYDSRKAAPGTLFVAMRGGYVDGHDYLQDALRRGASAALVDRDADPAQWTGFESVTLVEDSRAALASVAERFYHRPSKDLTLIGVTGTDGKTTTCFFLDHILSEAGHSTGLIGTVLIRIPGQTDQSAARQTTPESLETQHYLACMRDGGADVAVLEATSHGLETHRVDGCRFDIGLVTNVTHEHLDFHGSIENYRAAKGGLLRRVGEARHQGKQGISILNADDEGARALATYASDTDIIWYSPTGGAEASMSAVGVELTPAKSVFQLMTASGTADVSLPVPGSWNVSNALAAAATAGALGVDLATIARALSNMPPVPGRMHRVDAGQPFAVIVDYAHTPQSLASILTEARKLASGRVLTVFGSAGERDLEKRALQGAVAVELADYSVFTSEDPRYEDPMKIIEDIASGALRSGATESVDFDLVEDRHAAIEHVIGQARAGDVIILAGKGHERSMIYGADQRPWDEAEVARLALERLGYQRRGQ